MTSLEMQLSDIFFIPFTVAKPNITHPCYGASRTAGTKTEVHCNRRLYN